MLVSATSPNSWCHITPTQNKKFAMARTPSPAREPRALPRMSKCFVFYHDTIFRMMMLPTVLNGN